MSCPGAPGTTGHSQGPLGVRPAVAALKDEARMRVSVAGNAPRARSKIGKVSLVLAVTSVPALVLSQSIAATAAPAAPAARTAHVGVLQPLTAALAAQLSKNVSDRVNS